MILGLDFRKSAIIINVPILESKYLGILLNVPVEIGKRITSIEKIQRDDGIFLLPIINKVIKRVVKAKSI